MKENILYLDILQKEILDEIKFGDEIYLIEGKDLSQYGVFGRAYTDGYKLLFVGENSQDPASKFLYYMGAENEAEIEVKFRGVVVYKGISYDRLERYENEDRKVLVCVRGAGDVEETQ